MAKKHKEKENPNVIQIKKGIEIVNNNGIFNDIVRYGIKILDRNKLGRDTVAISNSNGDIYLNKDINLMKEQWAFAIVHCILHNCFGHYDLDKVPGYYDNTSKGKKVKIAKFNKKIWNIACDIYVDNFLRSINIGKPVYETPVDLFPSSVMEDEIKLYNYLLNEAFDENKHIYGVGAINSMDMQGLDSPLEYKKDGWNYNAYNWYSKKFAYNLARSLSKAIDTASNVERDDSFGRMIASWFVNSFPLIGAIASAFKIVEDINECNKYDISVAAVDAWEGIIYINRAKCLSEEEWRFVMAHEILHAALLHHRRSAGRDPYLWNVATDYVINGWLYDMKVGAMPEDCLYDKSLENMSAEEVYDKICLDIKTYMKMDTFRGYKKGDILGKNAVKGFATAMNGVNLDEFYRSALAQGLEYTTNIRGRGYIPAGLVEEIRALAIPPVPWDVKLSKWFNEHIEPLEKHRSYAHPSRRQSSTPNIPRPKYIISEVDNLSRTFGVIIDTSGSMSNTEIGKALGAVASYAVARDVRAVRVVFCDAQAYDMGYVTPDDIAGRVKVVGRGGTKIQPAIELLQNAKDFPKDGPILIITDGGIENRLHIKREHAYILPAGCRLPFPAKEVFVMK